MFVIDAPVSRVEAVLSRNKTIRDIVRNDWVRFLVRDPETKQVTESAESARSHYSGRRYRYSSFSMLAGQIQLDNLGRTKFAVPMDLNV